MPDNDLLRRRNLMRDVSIDNPHPRSAIREITAFLPQKELVTIANQFHGDDEIKEEVRKKIDAYLTVLTSKPEDVGENIQKALKVGVNFAGTDIYPLSASNVAIFNDERELVHYTGELATELISSKIGRIQEKLDSDGEDAAKLVKELSLIAQARIGGANPNEILTPARLRTSLATELAGRELFRQIAQARTDIRLVIAAFAKSSNGDPEIKGTPLMEGQQRIGQLCQELAKSLYEVDIMASVVSKGDGSVPIEPSGQYSEQTIEAIKRAQEVFRPFIDGSHLVTIEQLRGLESCLINTGEAAGGIASILRRAVARIKLEMEAGNHRRAQEIEEKLAFHKRVPEFENIVKSLDTDLSDRGIVIAYARVHNRMVLRSVPASMLEEVERNSGIPPGYTADALSEPDEGLIVPSSTPPPPPRLKS